MKTTVKRVIIILLVVLLLAGIMQFGPQLRFAFDLYTGRYDAAELIYEPSVASEDHERRQSFDKMIGRYMDRKLDRYYRGKLSYEDAMNVFADMDEHPSFHPYAVKRIQLVDEMETARRNLAHADTHYSNGDFAHAIPLYRQSLLADETAAQRLADAETRYRDHVLEQAIEAMDQGRYADAETALLEGLEIMGQDDADLSLALKDARRMAADEAYEMAMATARWLMNEEGPQTAFQYLAQLRAQDPNDFSLELLQQRFLHEYEEDICTRAQALQKADDCAGACDLLTEGLTWIDSARLMTLLGDIRGAMPFALAQIPVLRDETADARTGVASSVSWDRVLTDIQGHPYSHSFSADIGSIVFDLGGDFALFSGTVAFPQGEKSDIYRASATLQIYGDETLLNEFADIDSASAPIPFSLSVTGVRELTLRWTCQGANGWQDWGRFATLFDSQLMMAVPSNAAEN